MAHLDEKGLATAFKHIKEILAPVKITYAELKKLRDAGELVAGRTYRVTDYEFTTTQSGTKSAGHVFDILVTAADEKTLLEEASAMRREGDENLDDATVTTSTDSDGNTVTTRTAYFANNNLSAWKIWYSLDNDTSKYAWADADNGKGVIYRLIDEFDNDVGYDFKNLLNLYASGTIIGTATLTADTYLYTFNTKAVQGDSSLNPTGYIVVNNKLYRITRGENHIRQLSSDLFASVETYLNRIDGYSNNNIFGGEATYQVYISNSSYLGSCIFKATIRRFALVAGQGWGLTFDDEILYVHLTNYLYRVRFFGRVVHLNVLGNLRNSEFHGRVQYVTISGFWGYNIVQGVLEDGTLTDIPFQYINVLGIVYGMIIHGVLESNTSTKALDGFTFTGFIHNSNPTTVTQTIVLPVTAISGTSDYYSMSQHIVTSDDEGNIYSQKYSDLFPSTSKLEITVEDKTTSTSAKANMLLANKTTSMSKTSDVLEDDLEYNPNDENILD